MNCSFALIRNIEIGVCTQENEVILFGVRKAEIRIIQTFASL